MEELSLSKLLTTPQFIKQVESLVCLEATVRDLYESSHWALQGTPPAFDTPDSNTYLIERNVSLLAKTGILCAQWEIGTIALGPLADNIFPDATIAFCNTIASALSLGLNHDLEIVSPFRQLSKTQVVQLGVELSLPLELTLSCMPPVGSHHCGRCSKCRERLEAFKTSCILDPAAYEPSHPRVPSPSTDDDP